MRSGVSSLVLVVWASNIQEELYVDVQLNNRGVFYAFYLDNFYGRNGKDRTALVRPKDAITQRHLHS